MGGVLWSWREVHSLESQGSRPGSVDNCVPRKEQIVKHLMVVTLLSKAEAISAYTFTPKYIFPETYQWIFWEILNLVCLALDFAALHLLEMFVNVYSLWKMYSKQYQMVGNYPLVLTSFNHQKHNSFWAFKTKSENYLNCYSCSALLFKLLEIFFIT